MCVLLVDYLRSPENHRWGVFIPSKYRLQNATSDWLKSNYAGSNHLGQTDRLTEIGYSCPDWFKNFTYPFSNNRKNSHDNYKFTNLIQIYKQI